MYKEPFYGLFLIGLNKEVTKDEKRSKGISISKNSINSQLTINEDYWNKLKDPIKEGKLKEQLLHLAFQHVSMRDKFPDKEVFDLAADIEVNQYINKENLAPDSKTPDSFPDLNLGKRQGVRKYYDVLYVEKQKQNPSVMGALGDSSGEHKTWDEFAEGTDAEKDLIKRQIDHQLKEVYNNVKSRGLVPGELEAYISNLFKPQEKIFNWKAYLRRFINGSVKYYTKKTRCKLNKRFPGNPALKVKPRARILIGVDTSGSVSNGELKDFFSEIYHAWKCGVMVDIVECDSRMYPPYEYKGKWDGKVNGRGGTHFQPVIDFYNQNRKKYSTLIYFTDGECSAPTKPTQPMLWVISSNASTRARDQFEFLPWYKFIIPKNSGN